MFVRPDIDYFAVFTLQLLYGKRERSERQHRKKIILKLKWVIYISHQNWAILRGDNDKILIDNGVLAPVQLIQSVPSQTIVLEKDMKWQAPNIC